MMDLKKNREKILKEEFHVLKTKFKEIQLMTYPNSDAVKVIKFLQIILESFSTKLKNFERLTDIEIRELSKFIKWFYIKICSVVYLNMKNTPVEIMVPIRNILKKLNSNYIFITEPSLEYNYAIGVLIDANIPLKDFLFLDSEKISGTVIRIIFPLLHKNNILYGGVVAHEFGHFLDLHYKLDISSKILAFYLKNSKLFNENPELKKNIEVLNILKNWIGEIIADIIGIYLYSLASFFAFQHVLHSSVFTNDNNIYIDNFSYTHPRNKIRTFIMIKTLEKLNYKSYVDDNLITLVKEYFEIWKDCVCENKDIDILILLEKDLESNTDVFIDIVGKELKNLPEDISYDFSKLKTLVPKAIKKIIDIIPPNEAENGEPIDEISILNAGWIAYLQKYEEIKLTLNSEEYKFEDIEIKEIIDNLVKKATISSDIHSRWLQNEIDK